MTVTPTAPQAAIAQILVVEDEPMVAEVVERYLAHEGYRVEAVRDGDAAWAAFQRLQPDLVVLDVMLPGRDGFDLCRAIRGVSPAAVIMLTARTDEVDKLDALGLGADDYVTKPFSPRELVARAKAVLRRTKAAETGATLRVGPVVLDGRRRSCRAPGGEIVLGAREFDLLWYLAAHPGQVFSRRQLLDAVWGHDFAGDESTVTVHIRRLRRKVEEDPDEPRHLRTVWGVGYKLQP